MKNTITFSVLGLAGQALAATCNNNCGRQVIGTNNKIALSSRQALCSDFLTTTTTVTPATVTATSSLLFNRNVHNRQAPIVTGTVPAYATSCPDPTAYWSACQCFSIIPTVVTITAPTPTTIVAGPTCTQGLEYAMYYFSKGSTGAQTLTSWYYNNLQGFNVPSLIAGVTPALTGVSSSIGHEEIGFNSQGGLDFDHPLSFSDTVAPDNTRMEGSAVEYRGYLHPSQTGTYTLTLTLSDDILAVWAGDSALSGYTLANTVMKATLFYQNTKTYSLPVTAGSYIPFRIFWADSGGPAGLLLTITDPNGATILSNTSPKNSQVISSCSGTGAPVGAWPAWEAEA